jgi:hypothetical protein
VPLPPKDPVSNSCTSMSQSALLLSILTIFLRHGGPSVYSSPSTSPRTQYSSDIPCTASDIRHGPRSFPPPVFGAGLVRCEHWRSPGRKHFVRWPLDRYLSRSINGCTKWLVSTFTVGRYLRASYLVLFTLGSMDVLPRQEDKPYLPAVSRRLLHTARHPLLISSQAATSSLDDN